MQHKNYYRKGSKLDRCYGPHLLPRESIQATRQGGKNKTEPAGFRVEETELRNWGQQSRKEKKDTQKRESHTEK